MKKILLISLILLILGVGSLGQCADHAVPLLSQLPNVTLSTNCSTYIGYGQFCYNTGTGVLYLGNGSTAVAVSATESDPVVGAINGIIQANGAGAISAVTGAIADIKSISFAKGYTLYYDGTNIIGLAPLGTNAFSMGMYGTIPVWYWVTASKPICSDSNGLPVACTTITGTFGGFTASKAIQSDASGNLVVANALPATIGGTGQTGYTIGDILYAASTTTVDKLAAVAAGQVLVSAGTGTAPAWSSSLSISALKLGTVTKAFADTGYTASSTDFSIMWNAVGGACVQNLPAATGTGRVLEIKKVDASANLVTVTTNGGELLDGFTTQTLTAQWEAITIQDTASGVWHIL